MRRPVGDGWRWFQIRVRSSSSQRQVRTHRFVIAFIEAGPPIRADGHGGVGRKP